MKMKTITAIECHPLRHQVLWPHIKLEKDCVIDIDDRDDAIHIGAIVNDEIISVCSLFQMSSNLLDYQNQYRLRAMATDPNMRGKSAGKLIVKHAIELLKKNKHDVLWCDARQIAIGFYEKLGFQGSGHFYEVKNIGLHQLMYFPL